MAKSSKGISNSQSQFLKLVRIGLMGQCGIDVLEQDETDWEEVLKIAAKHKLAAVVYDGILSNDQIGETHVDEDTRLKFVGYQFMQVHRYQKNYRFLSNLTRFYNSHQIPVMLLKGYGLSQYWPTPQHRPVGDVDIYMYGHCEIGDRYIHESFGVPITYYPVGHHTTFHLQGETVENHTTFLSITVLGRKMRQYEAMMRLSAHDCQEISMGEGVCCLPSATFNALYLVAHMSTHFLSDCITLRQICDWALFLKSDHDKVDWNHVTNCYRKGGLERFVGTINRVAEDVIGMNLEWSPAFVCDQQAVKRITEEMIEEQNNESKPNCNLWKKIADNIKRNVGNCWKYHLLGRSFVIDGARKGLHLMRCPQDYVEQQLY